MALEHYRTQVDGQWFDVVLEKSGDRVIVKSGDKSWSADLKRFQGTNLVSLILDNTSLEFLISKQDDTYNVQRGTDLYAVKVKSSWANAKTGFGAHEGESGEVSVDSPLTGVIVRIEVEKGKEVAKGDVLLVVEAMKMQNEIKAPKAGVVKAVKVKPGQKVTMRQSLLTIG
ncbi:MAG: acetyl-CoA carboxylase biotin carboxyl carrier protein subunit [Chloroflexi bacterium]|nr:acetyl-CoA carboxylase biotin carboxyl carrier protein subunit [Chloroflexota bacterium]